MKKTIAKEMMEEFLDRQKQYDFIYRKNSIYGSDQTSELPATEMCDKINCAIKQVNKVNHLYRKPRSIVKNKETHEMRTKTVGTKDNQQEILKLDFLLISAIIFPFLGLFGLMLWFAQL